MAEGRLFTPLQGLEIIGLKPGAGSCVDAAVSSGRGGPGHCRGRPGGVDGCQEGPGGSRNHRLAGWAGQGSPDPLGYPLSSPWAGFVSVVNPPSPPLRCLVCKRLSQVVEKALGGGQGRCPFPVVLFLLKQMSQQRGHCLGGDCSEKGESKALFAEDRSSQHRERQECTELIPGPTTGTSP